MNFQKWGKTCHNIYFMLAGTSKNTLATYATSRSISTTSYMKGSLHEKSRDFWLHAITIFWSWKNAITIHLVRDMPLQL
jgi:hypothetical protein